MKRYVFLITILFALIRPNATRAQCQLPGFAIGQFHNDHVYGVGQTFTLTTPAQWMGFAVFFGESIGTPKGRVVWELRADHARLAHGIWKPEPMRMNEISIPSITLAAGVYAIHLRPVRWREAGHYNVLATCEDTYPSGTLLQLQIDGGQWAAWNNHDLISRIRFEDTDDIIIAPRPNVLFIHPPDIAGNNRYVLY